MMIKLILRDYDLYLINIFYVQFDKEIMKEYPSHDELDSLGYGFLRNV